MKDDSALSKREPVRGEAALRKAIEESGIEAPADLVELGFEIVGLVSQFADEGTNVDRGCGLGAFDCHVTVNGRDYDIQVTAGSTEEERVAEYAEDQRVASCWDSLCPRVIEALRAGPDQTLADEFEGYVTPKSDDSL